MNQAKDRNNKPIGIGHTVVLTALILAIGDGKSPKNLHVRAVGEPREYVPEFEIASACVQLVEAPGEVPAPVAESKAWRKAIDDIIQQYRKDTAGACYVDGETNAKLTQLAEEISESAIRTSNERTLSSSRLWEACEETGGCKLVKMQEAVMWLGMDLKAYNETSPGAAPSPYPESYNPKSAAIEPTADNLKL